jgi:NAD(P)H-nitrite reductase large subunit
LDETESRIIERRLEQEGVNIYFHTELGEILGRKGHVDAVQTKDGKLIKCGILAYAIGIQPRVELARQAGIMIDRGILVDESMQTSIQDIYAAGDVAQVYDPLTKKNILDSLWKPARDQGYTAGSNMTDQGKVYVKSVAFNVTRLAGLTTTIIGVVGQGRDPDIQGIARGDSETWRQLPDAISAQSNFDVNRLRIILDKQHIIGAVIMGDQTLSQPLQRLITDQVDIQPIREKLLSKDSRLADVIVDFYTQVYARKV